MAGIATKKSKVGFIALGDIGLPMVSNLVKNGFKPMVFDLRKEPVNAAVRMGAKAADSVKTMAQQCDFICIALVGAPQMEQVLEGPNGIFANAKRGTAILSHATMPPENAKDFARRAKAKGLEWLDTPMSGANIAAKAGTLTWLVGGTPALLKRCQPILNAMGTNTFLLGEPGAGQVGKLVNGLMFHVGYVATLEALKLAQAYNVPEKLIIDLAKVSTGNCWMVQNWGYMDRLVDSHPQGTDSFVQTHVRKDIADALIAAKSCKKAMPMTAVSYQIYPDLLIERAKLRAAGAKKKKKA